MGRILLDHLSRRYGISLSSDEIWNDHQCNRAKQLLNEIAAGRPTQYVLNESWFDDCNYWVDESVLIPRPETEELLDWIKRHYVSIPKPSRVLDIGTGSGILPISLKRAFKTSTIQALDLSSAALATAQKNAARLEANIELIQLDFTDNQQRSSLLNYDLIVSNPPYIALEEKSGMANWVIEHEPHLALFTPNEDPLLFYRCIGDFGLTHLNPGGQIFVELHEDRAEQTQQLFEQFGYKTELRKDMQGKWRMLRAEINK